MAFKASLGEIFDNPKLWKQLKAFTMAVSLYQITAFILSGYFQVFYYSLDTCRVLSGSALGQVNFFLLLICFCFGMYYDLCLTGFIRSFGQVQPTVQMAVWSTGPIIRTQNNRNNILSDSVPLKSTVLNSLGLVFIFIGAAVIKSIDPEDQHGYTQILSVLAYARCGLHMIWTLALTVKNQNRVQPRTAPVPPRELQYYDNVQVFEIE